MPYKHSQTLTPDWLRTPCQQLCWSRVKLHNRHLRLHKSPAGVEAAGALRVAGRLGVLPSCARFATAGTGGEAALAGDVPKETSSCSKSLGLSPGGRCFRTALPTLACTCTATRLQLQHNMYAIAAGHCLLAIAHAACLRLQVGS